MTDDLSKKEIKEIKKSVWSFFFKLFLAAFLLFLIAILVMTLVEPSLVKSDLKDSNFVGT